MVRSNTVFETELGFAQALFGIEEEILNKKHLGLPTVVMKYVELTNLSAFLETDGRGYFSKYAQRIALCFSLLQDVLVRNKLLRFVGLVDKSVPADYNVEDTNESREVLIGLR